MKPFQERVVEEKKELDQKLDKLTEFLKHTQVPSISAAELERLTRQRALMESYSGVLAERIANFTP